MYVSFCWSANTGVSMRRSPKEERHLCPACIAHLNWIVCEMGTKWSYNSCFVVGCFQNYLKQHAASLCRSRRAFFSNRFVRTQIATAWKNSFFILSERLDFLLVVNQSIAVHAFPMCMLTSLSGDEMLLPKYMNWSINFSGSILIKTFTCMFKGCSTSI